MSSILNPSSGTGSSSQAGLPRGERFPGHSSRSRSAMYPDTNAVVSYYKIITVYLLLEFYSVFLFYLFS